MAKTVEPAPRLNPGHPPSPLSRPFFEDKARAFWMLQAAGWSGYLLLRSVSSVSNNFAIERFIPVIIEAIVGYCLTLLLSALYGYYRRLPRITGILLTLATLAAATVIYAVIDAFTFSFGLSSGIFANSAGSALAGTYCQGPLSDSDRNQRPPIST